MTSFLYWILFFQTIILSSIIVIYKQIHDCALGSPVNPIVATLCLEVIEELAISTSPVPSNVWKRYVDSFVIIKKDAASSFHNTLNA